MKCTIRSVPIIVFAVFAMLAADSVMAQRGGGGRFQGRGNFFGGAPGGGSLGLLANERVQEELELVDDQLEELRGIQEASRQAMQELMQEMRDGGGDRGQMFEGFREKMAERMKKYEEQVNDLLLPHQANRLKQLAFQSSGRGRGAGGALSNQALLDELGVTDTQREELEAAAAKAREELQKKYQKLVQDAEQDILKVLSKNQQEKYRELVGEPFQFDDGRNRGARGQRGNRGRNRGEQPRRDF